MEDSLFHGPVLGRSFSMAPDPEFLMKHLTKLFLDHEVSVAYEAGCCGYHIPGRNGNSTGVYLIGATIW
ncbi:hypothetical protein MWU78_21225 [Arenibacter sp. F26102]|uniref:hypothetical protein n=1 Tax=Arenibacter sp. F26102 TaxID=2926416 RepID=UPI001FF625C3|nr:hypothetical protein [Arenibacter sp. F26102]MCK0148183.1 hypothetical protein [Arenibacter sp. F26102]